MPKIKVGIVGYGKSAKVFHLPFIKAIPDYEIIAVLQRAEAPAPGTEPPTQQRHCTIDFPGIRHYRTPEAFFADHDIDFVLVLTHGDTHAWFAMQALAAGKHVMVDKPFAKTCEDVEMVSALAREKGLVATCYQNRRWDGGFRTLRSLLAKNALGDIKEAEIYYDFEDHSWIHTLDQVPQHDPAVGMAFALGSHTTDQALQLFGQPTSVTGFFRTQRGGASQVEDSFTIILQYLPKSDLLVTIKTSIISPLDKQIKFIVKGTKGSYIKYQQRSTCPQEEDSALGISPLDPKFGVEPETLDGTLTTVDEFDGSFQNYDEKTGRYVGRCPTIAGCWSELYQNVADAIFGKQDLQVKLEEARDSIKMLLLARESHDKGVTVAWR